MVVSSKSMFVRFLLVFDLLFILFRIALWPSDGKELSYWLFSCVVCSFSSVLFVLDETVSIDSSQCSVTEMNVSVAGTECWFS